MRKIKEGRQREERRERKKVRDWYDGAELAAKVWMDGRKFSFFLSSLSLVSNSFSSSHDVTHKVIHSILLAFFHSTTNMITLNKKKKKKL